MRHPLAMDGRVSPEPRMAGGDLVAGPAENSCFPPFYASGLKPSLATTTAKARSV
ncbi:MAG TPA: hypothetical protein VFC58_16605 [Desulfosporosinus sp.]|nr:hypothetical protein [Desulfosporosinus sp.]